MGDVEGVHGGGKGAGADAVDVVGGDVEELHSAGKIPRIEVAPNAPVAPIDSRYCFPWVVGSALSCARYPRPSIRAGVGALASPRRSAAATEGGDKLVHGINICTAFNADMCGQLNRWGAVEGHRDV